MTLAGWGVPSSASTTSSAGATITPVKIEGANYECVDTDDGYVVVKDVFMMGEVKEGVKGAPKTYKGPELQKAVDEAQKQYREGKYAMPAHKGHHKALQLNDPEFLGFALPKKVERAVIEGVEQDVVKGDVKVKASAFERIAKGEIPFVSPEFDWDTGTFTSLSFLDSKPPHFKAPLFTVKAPVKDPSAKFEASLKPAKFEEDEEGGGEKKEKPSFPAKKDGGKSEGKPFDKGGKPDGKFGDEQPGQEQENVTDKPLEVSSCCGHCAMNSGAIRQMAQMLSIPYGGQMDNTKPGAGPVDQSAAKPSDAPAGAKFEMDPRAAAKFAALEDKQAALEAQLAERDRKEKAKLMAESAIQGLAGYQVGEKTKANIAKFALEGEDRLKEYVESVKEIAPKVPHATLRDAEIGSVSIDDPKLAKFAKDGPDKLEKVAQFAAEFRRIKAAPFGRFMQTSEEQFVEQKLREMAGGDN